MKKTAIFGASKLVAFKKDKLSFDDALIRTKNEINQYYESDKCSKEELLQSLKRIKKYEFFVNTVIPSVCLGYITFAITYIIECLITGEINNVFVLPDLTPSLNIVMVIALLAIIVFVPILLLYKMITDTLNMCSDDYISFVMPYEKHIIVKKLNEDNSELSEILNFTEFSNKK
jgi:hypothetical protein